ncbi:MAG: replicative DNA helicase [Deltaproteobacteria bacterium]|nr:replicative DNA helicase [Deltaproteobacteria bacterium]MBW2183156.1 replicative DNA helicase [Deltaproteobacteria bacterium]
MLPVDISNHKVPPQNIEAEQCVLGGVLLENEAISKVLETLVPDDFYREPHRKICHSMIDLFEKNEPIDLITLTNALKGKNLLDEVGGGVYLSSLADSITTAANIEYYAKIVKEKAILRGLINTATEIVTRGYEDGGDVEDLLDQAEKNIFQISESKIKPSFYEIKNLLKESFKTIEKLYESKEIVTGVPSGFEELDKLTSGFQPSDLVVIAGRPSMGKTAFSLNIAQYAAIEKKIPSALFSLEMSKEQLVLRMLCSEAKVDAHKLRGGFLGETDWPKLTRAAGILSEAPIFIDDTPALSVLEMRAKARRLMAEHELGLVIVDYLQLMRGRGLSGRGRPSSETREQEISDITRSLKALAKELNIPVIALSQLNRKVEERTDKRPHLADLRESGAIEQDADLITFIYRDEIYNRADDNPNKGIAEVIIGKQRNGPVGEIKLAFLDKYTTFENLAWVKE